jgi:hypothetical protein
VPNCLAANDNASGVAAVLEVARVLAQGPHRRTTIASCWDAEETGAVGSWVYASEAKAAGWVNIKINFVFDMIGWYSSEPDSQALPGGQLFASQFPGQAEALAANQNRADFIGLVGNGQGLGGKDGAARYAEPFQSAASAVGLSSLAIFPNFYQALGMLDVLRSDHSSFWLNGYNAVFVTDTGEFRQPAGSNRYHCLEAPDTIDQIDFDRARKVAQATATALQWAADE